MTATRALQLGSLAWLLAVGVVACGPDTEPEPEPGAVAPAVPAPVPRVAPAGKAPPPPGQPFPLEGWARPLAEVRLAPEIRVWVIQQVAEHPDPGAVEMLASLLEEEDPAIVRAAVDGLVSRPEPEARELLLPLRAHPDPYVTRRVGALVDEP